MKSVQNYSVIKSAAGYFSVLITGGYMADTEQKDLKEDKNGKISKGIEDVQGFCFNE